MCISLASILTDSYLDQQIYFRFESDVEVLQEECANYSKCLRAWLKSLMCCNDSTPLDMESLSSWRLRWHSLIKHCRVLNGVNSANRTQIHPSLGLQ